MRSSSEGWESSTVDNFEYRAVKSALEPGTSSYSELAYKSGWSYEEQYYSSQLELYDTVLLQPVLSGQNLYVQ
jgi:hypothetical protein